MAEQGRGWKDQYEAAALRRDRFQTLSFEDVPALGVPDGEPVPDKIGYPGSYPYTRGIHATGYRGRLWTMRQFAGFASVADTNERLPAMSTSTDGLSASASSTESLVETLLPPTIATRGLAG